jgi:hypothetical protein
MKRDGRQWRKWRVWTDGENGFNCDVIGGVVYEEEGGGHGQLNPRLSIWLLTVSSDG